jgi:peptide deformylase
MIREIVRMGDPRLLQRARPVTGFGSAELQNLIADMLETMRHYKGVGIAAPQIGVDLQVVLFGVEHSDRYPEAESVPLTALCNPELEFLDKELEEGWEGCLSVPGLRGVVPRYRKLRYRGQGASGETIARVATGFHARVVQHECDHLWGMLYPMRMHDFTRFGYTDILFPEVAAREKD